ncbi:MAG: hypothetical protein HDQ98_01485 [Lachnospiraceae bacterium]|nr:hypothetical protein [Lachnospiraceae bacterium]
MKAICEMIKYQYKQYMISAKWVMPFIVLLGTLSMMYSISPVAIVDSFSMTGIFLFVIMVWIGRTIQGVEPEVSEQVMILRLKSDRKYYLCHIIFMMCICAVVTGISIVVPVLIHIRSGNALLSRQFTWSDFVGGGLLMLVCSFVGGMAGELFHIRIMKNRTVGIGVTFFITLLAVCRNGVIAEFAAMKYILWVIPPISDVVSWFTNKSYFNMGEVMKGFLLLLIYGGVMAVMKVEMLKRVKF